MQHAACSTEHTEAPLGALEYPDELGLLWPGRQPHVTGDGYIFAINHRAYRAQGSPTGDWGENRTASNRTETKRNDTKRETRAPAQKCGTDKKQASILTMTMTTKIAPVAVLGMSRLARDLRLGLTCAISCQLSHNSAARRARGGTRRGIGSREIGFIDLLKQFTNVTSLEFIYLCFTATRSCWCQQCEVFPSSYLPPISAIFISVAIKCHKTYIV